mmetsp:Transcript_55165/g.108959  ORF Transcript_55165/g.108959 Transcript_55165/m.108959 type:complete len:175 (+) Transcript_55165:56-580(+)
MLSSLTVSSQRFCSRQITRSMANAALYRKSGKSTSKGPKIRAVEMPKFAELLRKFYKLTHPDLLRASSPELADINDQSWQTLNNVLSTIKTVNAYPPRMKQSIPFHMRSQESDSGYKPVVLTISTGGGDCKKQFGVTMKNFFKASGISPDGNFIWGKEYFPTEVYGKIEEEEEY